jgi:MSV199 domain/Protein of unknown function (DUF3627)
MAYKSVIVNSQKSIKAALKASHKMVTPDEFIVLTEYPIDIVMVNELWKAIAYDNTLFHVSKKLLEWLGYEGEYKNQKQNFTRYLTRGDISYEEILGSDPKAAQFPTIQEDMINVNSKNQRVVRWLLVQSWDFKKAIMKLSTKNGDMIRDYYLNLERLFKLYTAYTVQFRERETGEQLRQKDEKIDYLLSEVREMQDKLDQVLIKNDELLDQNGELSEDVADIASKLNIACKDRAPRPMNRRKQEKLVMLKWANLDYHNTIEDPKQEDDHNKFRYYVIRAQNPSADKAVRDQKEKDPKLEVILEFTVQPNTRTLYNRIKEDLTDEGVKFLRNSISLAHTKLKESQLIATMRQIEVAKYDV